MMAHIAMLRALNHGDPGPAPAPRRKRAKPLQDHLAISLGFRAASWATELNDHADLPAARFDNFAFLTRSRSCSNSRS